MTTGKCLTFCLIVMSQVGLCVIVIILSEFTASCLSIRSRVNFYSPSTCHEDPPNEERKHFFNSMNLDGIAGFNSANTVYLFSLLIVCGSG